MSSIRLLPENIINLIAAGEVVERPASALKEVLENSIDANSNFIRVNIKEFGLELIEVIDNGKGIEQDDLLLAIKQHATSKIYVEEDLLGISSLGFRGEALASIAEVSSKLEIESKTQKGSAGILIWEKGKARIEKSFKQEPGTVVKIHNVLSTVPARKKFLKSSITEFKKICDTFLSISLVHLNIHFELYHQDKLIYRLTQTDDFKNRVFEIWGRELSSNIIESSLLKTSLGDLKIFVGKPEIARKTAGVQYIFVNNRYVFEKTISSAISEAFKGFLPKELKPVYFLSLHIDPKEIDVNIHPRKLEIRFSNPGEIFRLVYQLTRKTLDSFTKNSISASMPSFYASSKTFASKAEPTFNRSFRVKNDKNDIQVALNFTKEIGEILNNDYPEAETTFSKRNDINSFLQLFNTYIVYEQDDRIIFIDQHAAAEKINFEKIVNTMGKPFTKPLLVPEVMELSHPDWLKAISIKDNFAQIGISIEEFGKNTIKVTEIPEILSKDIRINETILKLIEGDFADTDAMFEKYKEIYPGLTTENYYFIATAACHSSIRAGQTLTHEEIRQLLQDLDKLKNPYNCPHGRPVMWTLERSQFEKNFKRKL